MACLLKVPQYHDLQQTADMETARQGEGGGGVVGRGGAWWSCQVMRLLDHLSLSGVCGKVNAENHGG